MLSSRNILLHGGSEPGRGRRNRSEFFGGAPTSLSLRRRSATLCDEPRLPGVLLDALAASTYTEMISCNAVQVRTLSRTMEDNYAKLYSSTLLN